MADTLSLRSERIVKFLLRTGTATIEEILAEAGSSAPSIRRDLARLENRGLIRRTHGGATLVEPLLYEPFRYDSSFLAREQRHAEEKRRIGLAAAELVLENETIGLTAGTTRRAAIVDRRRRAWTRRLHSLITSSLRMNRISRESRPQFQASFRSPVFRNPATA